VGGLYDRRQVGGMELANQSGRPFQLPHPNQPTQRTKNAQIREAFILLRYWPSEQKLQLLLTQAGGRKATLDRKAAEKAALRHHIHQKQRSQLHNKLHRARLRAQRRLRFGQGWWPTAKQAEDARAGRPVKATWQQRKLRPPGKMQRRF